MTAELCSSQQLKVPGREGKAPTLPRHRHQRGAQPTQSIHPCTPFANESPPYPNQLFSVAWGHPCQPHVLLRGTWQQVPTPHRLILLPATGQGLTGINTSTKPLATCLSIRGANLPAPRMAGGGAALSRLTSSPVGHWGWVGKGQQGLLQSLNPGLCWAPLAGCSGWEPTHSPHPPKPPPGSGSASPAGSAAPLLSTPESSSKDWPAGHSTK